MRVRLRWCGERGEFRFERAEFAFEAGLAIPDECHVEEDRGENRAIGGEQESEVIHHHLFSMRWRPAQTLSARNSTIAIVRAASTILVRVRSTVSRSIKSHANIRVNAATDTSSVTIIRGSSRP